MKKWEQTKCHFGGTKLKLTGFFKHANWKNLTSNCFIENFNQVCGYLSQLFRYSNIVKV